MGSITFASICGIILSVTQLSASQPVATIDGSKIHGRTITITEKHVSEFLGIRYATPPVNERRFLKPEPSSKYPENFFAVNPPPSCWQISIYDFPFYDGKNTKSEDCLFLNIWAPQDASASNPKAVIFWIHSGDAFRYGSIQQDEMYGGPLSGLGDVVVVTVNYRVGAFGFLSSGTDDAPGNAALFDILEALRWVNKNIDAFGGDPSRITIAGQSTASIFIGFLSVSPLAKGLFRRQIMVSGSPARPDSQDAQLNVETTQELAEKLQCANETFTVKDNPSVVVDCLKNKPAEELSEKESQIFPTYLAFTSQQGGELLPASSGEAVMKKDMQCDEALIGNVLDEGSFQLTTTHPDKFGFFGKKQHQVSKAEGEHLIRDLFEGHEKLQNHTSEIVAYYLDRATNPKSIRKQVYDSVGDADFLCPTEYYAEQCAAKGGKVYRYVWRQRPSGSPWATWMGATLLSDAAFVAGRPILRPNEFTETEVALSKQVIEIWSSFAKDGKPSLSWPLFSKDNSDTVYLGPGPVPQNGKGLHRKNCDFFRPISWF